MRGSSSGGSGSSRLPEHLAGVAVGQLVDADDLDGEIVVAAELEGLSTIDFARPDRDRPRRP